MNFSIAAKGHSFKGAFAYYLHDKGAQTAERVAWAETCNLAHDDPAYAQSVMIATARNADALKAAAGVKATGRKATGGPVHAYSISWHPENETVPDRAGMLAVAQETLKLLKADHLQAVIIAHQDTAHPHVHVVVNRVDPATGKMHTFGNDAHKLDEWAAKYERDRGQIVSPNRDQKHEDRKRQKAAPVSAKVAFANHAPPPAAKPDKSRAAMLAELQAAQKERHKQEWVDLSAANKARREAIKAERVDFKGIAAQHRAETRPLWSRLGKDQAAERRAFLDREKRLSGIVRNAIDIVRNQQIRGVADDRGFLAMCFNYTISKSARRAAFNERQQDAKAELARTLDAALIAKFGVAKAGQGAKLGEARTVYDAARAALIERQNSETAKVREGWRQLYADREREGYAGPRTPWGRRSAANDSQARAPGARSATPAQGTRPTASPNRGQHEAPAGVKRDFENAGQLAAAKQSPEEERAAQWARLEEMGRKAKEQGLTPGFHRARGRELRRE